MAPRGTAHLMAYASERHVERLRGPIALIGRWLKAERATRPLRRSAILRQAANTASAAAVIERDIVIDEEFTPLVRSPSNGDIHLDIDIIDKCNLQCPTCWRGVAAQKNTSATMPLPRFREIVSKARAEGYPNVSLINWTEAFLCKTLHEYVAVVKEAGLDCWISSNLSLPPKEYSPAIIAALSSGVDILTVSVSGFTQSIYEINHKRGRI